MKPKYNFPDWFSQNIPNFTEIKFNLPNRKDILEIGSFEGRSSTWLLQNFVEPEGTLTCIDTFEGSPEHDQMSLSNIKSNWQHNTELARTDKQVCRLINKKSYEGVAQLIQEGKTFDFIYVDGSHTAPDVLTDACMCAGLLRIGGVILFDDYLWPKTGDHRPSTLTDLKTPKPAVNAFATVYAELMQPVISNYQVAFKKIV